MPEDKRPKATIDMTAEHVSEPVPPQLEAPAGTTEAGESVAAEVKPERPGRSGGGFFSHLVASIAGAAIALGGAYAISQRTVPGLSLTDPATLREITRLQEQTASLESRLRAVRSAPAPAAQAAATPGHAELNELSSRVDSVAGASAQLNRALGSLTQRVQALEQKSGNAETRVQAEVSSQMAPLAQRLTSDEHKIETVARIQGERQDDARSAALALALVNLKRAINEGRPFAGELSVIDNLSPAQLPVAQLAPYKNDGVLSMAGIKKAFTEASQKTIEKEYSKTSTGFMGEVLSRAKEAIQVRPSDSSGDTVEAILGRMGNALQQDDLKKAVSEGAALKDPPQAMKNWIAKAQARLSADEALRKTDQELFASLTRPAAQHQ